MLQTNTGLRPTAPDGVRGNNLIVECYWRWHRKLMHAEALFDPSWECEPIRLQDRLRWADRLCAASGKPVPLSASSPLPSSQLLHLQEGQKPETRQTVRLLFAHPFERLILLKPLALQRLLCALSLLARRDDLRRCIDGPAVRALQAMVGTPALAAILRSQRVPQAAQADANLSVSLLVAQGFSRLTHAYDGEWTVVLQCLRLALPSDLPNVACFDDAAQVNRLLREAHVWYPETTWLFG